MKYPENLGFVSKWFLFRFRFCSRQKKSIQILKFFVFSIPISISNLERKSTPISISFLNLPFFTISDIDKKFIWKKVFGLNLKFVLKISICLENLKKFFVIGIEKKIITIAILIPGFSYFSIPVFEIQMIPIPILIRSTSENCRFREFSSL